MNPRFMRHLIEEQIRMQGRPVPVEVEPLPEKLPAAKAAVARLPRVVLTKGMLAFEEGRNATCNICFADQRLGTRVTRMYCSHCYCQDCLENWLLLRQNTCPNCRLELETDNAEFNRLVRQRMEKNRVPFRRSELDALSVKELKGLLTWLQITPSGLEKGDFVRQAWDSPRLTQLPEHDGGEDGLARTQSLYSLADLHHMSAPELSAIMNANQVLVPEGATADELRRRLAASGKIQVTDAARAAWAETLYTRAQAMAEDVDAVRDRLRRFKAGEDHIAECGDNKAKLIMLLDGCDAFS